MPSLQAQVTQPLDVDLSGDFAAQLTELKSAEQISDFLGKLLVLAVRNRISVRRAAVLAYITNQLLRTASIMKKEREDNSQMMFDMPGPSAIACRRQTPPRRLAHLTTVGQPFLGCPP